MAAHGLADEARVLRGGLEREDGLRLAAELTHTADHSRKQAATQARHRPTNTPIHTGTLPDAVGTPHGPTAVVAFNDRLASGIVQGLLTAGVHVPQDVSIVGFDNARRSANGQIPLTTIDQNAPLMARLALERAIGRAAAEYLPSEQILVPKLITRASTAPVSP